VRLLLVLQVLFWPLLLSDRAFAQRPYSFEEACRNGGWTTGPCAPKSEQTIGCKDILKGAFHRGKFLAGCNEATLSPVFDFEILIEMVGIPNVAAINALQLTILRSTGFNNASAEILDEPLPGEQGPRGPAVKRLIIYDPEWVKAAPAQAYLILGHEAGHLFCGHDFRTVDPSTIPEKELEADRFSGAALKRFEVYHGRAFLNDALKAAAWLYPAAGSRSHPPRAERVKAILLGYKSGSPCGNLAPAIRGYSPHPR
jgi:hypothetical protein